MKSRRKELLAHVYEFMQETKFEWHKNIEKNKSEVRIENANLEKKALVKL